MAVYYSDEQVTLHLGDTLEVLRSLPGESVDCIVTSPPYYGLRDYGVDGQYGHEATPTAYIETMRQVFAEARRILAVDGTMWLNLGDTYAGKGNAGDSVGMPRRADRANLIPTRVNTTAEAPYKSLLMIPERVSWALIEDGWTLRNRIVWHKTNAMPESVTDRLSTRHEALFLFVKSPRYHFDLDAIREPLLHPEALEEGIVFGGRNGGTGKTGGSRRRGGGDRSVYGKTWTERREAGAPKRHGQVGAAAAHDSDFATAPKGRNPGDVWTIPTQPFPSAHFAVMPPKLVEPCIAAGSRPGGVILDPFAGSCTVGMVANRLGRQFVGIDLSATYLDLALRTRLRQGSLFLGGSA
jgi:DNA modification methylase